MLKNCGVKGGDRMISKTSKEYAENNPEYDNYAGKCICGNNLPKIKDTESPPQFCSIECKEK